MSCAHQDIDCEECESNYASDWARCPFGARGNPVTDALHGFLKAQDAARNCDRCPLAEHASAFVRSVQGGAL